MIGGSTASVWSLSSGGHQSASQDMQQILMTTAVQDCSDKRFWHDARQFLSNACMFSFLHVVLRQQSQTRWSVPKVILRQCGSSARDPNLKTSSPIPHPS